ncbi:arylamine N-acetyltransferase family protein [Amycolatopsis cihanbeyliensis]|uniref:N-hydroxyarylamine O-acetyltransferase n=1 Tax=Amycolatopsis cihanbeyliensis TaxID=1128664 RepID=A0A542DPZ4_AMYCI|nr:arylamine N-acetyltransferase [Amycolatopsis cihanbeyliensis]TQJ05137.1 N-hydroxyarylamine O-acetyltransferase [Amycolatopsis cihanbeyliensis]
MQTLTTSEVRPVLGEAEVDSYLGRIGAERPAGPDAGALRELHRRHLVAVPYNNLAIHLDQEVRLDQRWLFEWIVEGHRGGMCYELNGAFAALLAGLGYRVDLLAARVFLGRRRLALPYSHVALRVEAEDGSRWLADVGFGKHSHYPLGLRERAEQAEPGGRFRLAGAEGDDLDVLRDGVPIYRLDQRARELDEFGGTYWWTRTAPESPYVRAPLCSRLTVDGGRVTLSGRTLTVTDAHGGRAKRELTDDDVLDTYRTLFALPVDRLPDRTDAPTLPWF